MCGSGAGGHWGGGGFVRSGSRRQSIHCAMECGVWGPEPVSCGEGCCNRRGRVRALVATLNTKMPHPKPLRACPPPPPTFSPSRTLPPPSPAPVIPLPGPQGPLRHRPSPCPHRQLASCRSFLLPLRRRRLPPRTSRGTRPLPRTLRGATHPLLRTFPQSSGTSQGTHALPWALRGIRPFPRTGAVLRRHRARAPGAPRGRAACI